MVDVNLSHWLPRIRKSSGDPKITETTETRERFNALKVAQFIYICAFIVFFIIYWIVVSINM